MGDSPTIPQIEILEARKQKTRTGLIQSRAIWGETGLLDQPVTVIIGDDQ
jgi:hypothetical protein